MIELPLEGNGSMLDKMVGESWLLVLLFLCPSGKDENYMSEQNRLLEGRVLPTLVRFALPFLAANILQTLYGTVDVMVVGKFGTTASVSAVSCGAQIMMLLTMLLLGFTNGASLLIGQYLGAKQPKQVARVIGTAIWTPWGRE